MVFDKRLFHSRFWLLFERGCALLLLNWILEEKADLGMIAEKMVDWMDIRC